MIVSLAALAMEHPEGVHGGDSEGGKLPTGKCWLTLADEKSEAVLAKSSRKKNTLVVEFGGNMVIFRKHLEYVCRKANSATTAPAKMLPIVGRSKHC